jgi:hypothetical protein
LSKTFRSTSSEKAIPTATEAKQTIEKEKVQSVKLDPIEAASQQAKLNNRSEINESSDFFAHSHHNPKDSS